MGSNFNLKTEGQMSDIIWFCKIIVNEQQSQNQTQEPTIEYASQLYYMQAFISRVSFTDLKNVYIASTEEGKGFLTESRNICTLFKYIELGFHNYHKIHQISFFCCCWLFCRSNNGHREQLCELLHSRKAQYAIIALVVIDMIIVIVELLLDLRAIEGGRFRHHWYHC